MTMVTVNTDKFTTADFAAEAVVAAECVAGSVTLAAAEEAARIATAWALKARQSAIPLNASNRPHVRRALEAADFASELVSAMKKLYIEEALGGAKCSDKNPCGALAYSEPNGRWRIADDWASETYKNYMDAAAAARGWRREYEMAIASK